MLGLPLVIDAIEAVTSLMGETIRGKLCATSRGEQLAMKQEPFFWALTPMRQLTDWNGLWFS